MFLTLPTPRNPWTIKSLATLIKSRTRNRNRERHRSAVCLLNTLTITHLPPWWLGLRHGALLFDAGAYWDAHEAWERIWRSHPSADRHYLKGLIQFAAAFFHLRKRNAAAARRLLDLGPGHLLANHPQRWPIDTAYLVTVAASLTRSLNLGQCPHPPRVFLTRMLDAWAVEQMMRTPFSAQR